jgi:hypothetical protein
VNYGDCVETDPGSGCNYDVSIHTGPGGDAKPFAEQRYMFVRERVVAGHRFGIHAGGNSAVMREPGLDVVIESREAPVDRWLRFVRPLQCAAPRCGLPG